MRWCLRIRKTTFLLIFPTTLHNISQTDKNHLSAFLQRGGFGLLEKYSFRQGFSLPLSYHPKIPFYLLPLYKQQLLAGPLLHLLAFTMNKEVFRTCIHNRMMQAGQGIFPPCKAKNRSNTWCIARFFNAAGREKTWPDCVRRL